MSLFYCFIIKKDIKKLFKFLKKVILILEAAISLSFMFKNACFLLFLGYVARYAPYEKQINILFLLYKKLGDINLNSF